MAVPSDGKGRVPSVRQNLAFLLVFFSPLSRISNHMTCLGVSLCQGPFETEDNLSVVLKSLYW